MSTNELALGPNDNIGALLGLLQRISENLVVAAQLIARLMQHDPLTIDKVREQAPSVPRSFLVNLLRVGEGSLHPKLFMASGAAYNRLKSLPYTVQEKVLEDGSVEVVIGTSTLLVPLGELTPEQVAQVFGPDGLRSADDQRAFLKRLEMAVAKPVPRSEAFPWLVKKDKVQILRPVELTRKDVMRILEELNA